MFKNIIVLFIVFFLGVSSVFASSGSNNSSSKFSCEDGTGSLCSDQFQIDTSLFSPGGKSFVGRGSKQAMTKFFTTLIQKLMIALGSIALIIMSIGAGFMIIGAGKDDNVNKGKTIIKSGIIALVIALSSYMMVSLLSHILYS